MIQKFISKGCCGRQSITFQLNRPIDKSLIDTLINNGFKELPHFTKAGMLYLENNTLIITGPLGNNKINIKCKTTSCDAAINNLENLLNKYLELSALI